MVLRLLVVTTLILIPFECTAQSARAQEIAVRGRVIDAETKEPLALSGIVVNNVQTTADTAGRFELRLPRQKSLVNEVHVRLAVIRIGYQPLRQDLTLRADSTLDLGTLKLQRAPLQVFVDPVNSVRHR